MKQEYAYFRAAGRSLEAIEGLEELKSASARARRGLKEEFGAASIYIDPLSDKDTIAALRFGADTPMPEGWAAYPSPSGRPAQGFYHAAPRAGSADRQKLDDASEIIALAASFSTLEDFFPETAGSGVGRRKPVTGDLNTAFVRASTRGGETGTSGMLQDHVTPHTADEPTMADDLDYMKMLGHWYIRVPNDKNGAPAFTPPDAVRVTLAEMIETDGAESLKRKGASGGGFMRNLPPKGRDILN